MGEMKTPFDHRAPEICVCQYPGGCLCGPGEKVLRNIAGRRAHGSMTPEEREWCLQEIGQVEGYRRADYEDESDPDLARGVLNAWTDFCRDKGLREV